MFRVFPFAFIVALVVSQHSCPSGAGHESSLEMRDCQSENTHCIYSSKKEEGLKVVEAGCITVNEHSDCNKVIGGCYKTEEDRFVCCKSAVEGKGLALNWGEKVVNQENSGAACGLLMIFSVVAINKMIMSM